MFRFAVCVAKDEFLVQHAGWKGDGELRLGVVVRVECGLVGFESDLRHGLVFLIAGVRLFAEYNNGNNDDRRKQYYRTRNAEYNDHPLLFPAGLIFIGTAVYAVGGK